MRFPSTDPTITAPSSYTIQIFWPSEFHDMPLTTDLFLLLIISSYQLPLYSIQTIINPYWSLDVSFWWVSFQTTTLNIMIMLHFLHILFLCISFFSWQKVKVLRIGCLTCIWPLWPSNVWFIDKLEGAASPFILPSFPDSSFRTLSSPSSPPQAIYPCSLFHPTQRNFVLFGMAI